MQGNGLDLGDVGFSLSADAEGLDRALATLRRFGDAVNTWEKRTDEASQKVTAAYMRQEKAMVGMYQKMANLQSQASRMRAPTEFIDQATHAVNRYVNTLSLVDKNGNPLQRSALEMQRAASSASGEISKLQNKLRDWQTETRRTAQAQKELAREAALIGKGRIQQQVQNIYVPSGKSAKASASVFEQAGLMGAPQAAANAHVAAWQKQQAAIRKVTDELNANANAHVMAYRTQQIALQKRQSSVQGAANAHVMAYQKEREAVAKQTEALNEATQKALKLADARVNALAGQAKRSFVPDNMIRGYEDALRTFQTKTATGVTSTKDLARAQTELQVSLSRTTQQIKDYTASQTAASRAEQIAQSAAARVRRVNAAAQVYKVPVSYQQVNTNNLQTYQQALFAGDRNKAATALTALNGSIAETQKKIANATAGAQRFSSTLRGMERATVLAMGPLSGLGARMAVMAALFESTSAKTALFIAGATGAGFALGVTAIAAVKARMAWEQWNSMLIAASGSVALAGTEFEYITGVADKYGQAIQGLVPSYANFATSTRLANVSLEDQRKIFEAFTTAGAALHWTTEQSNRAFLALEQMMSKGTVQSQELKLQMGQVLPGAFELAAKAAGVTQRQFAKLMEQGKVLTSEFAPKFAEVVKKVYEDAAKYGAKSIQADINRFSTNKFEVAKSFDEAIRASQLFHNMLISVNSAMEYLEANASKVVAGFVAGIATLVTMYIPALIVGLGKIATHMKTMTVLGAAMSAVTSGNIIKAVAQIGAMAAVGYGTYKALNSLMTTTNNKTQELIDKNAVALSTYQQLGEISGREKKAHIEALQAGIKEAKARIDAINNETRANILLAKSVETVSRAEEMRIVKKAHTEMLGKNPDKMGFLEQWGRTLGAAANPQTTPGAATKMAKAAKAKEDANSPAARIASEAARAKQELTKLEKMLADFDKLKETKDTSNTPEDDAAEKLKAKYEGTYNKVKKMFTDLQMLAEQNKFIETQFKLKPISREEFQRVLDRTEAQKAVADFFEGLKDKTKPAFIAKLEADFAGLFQANNIQGNTLEEKLINLQVVMKANERAAQDGAESLRTWSDAMFSAGVAAQAFENGLKNVDIATKRLNAELGDDAAGKAMEDYYNNLEKKREKQSELWDSVLDIPGLDGNAFAEQLGRAEEALDKYGNALDRAAAHKAIGYSMDDANSIVSSAEDSLQSRVITGLETETSARMKLKRIIGEQGRALQTQLVPAIHDLMKSAEGSPRVVAQLQAVLDKIEEMNAIGRQTTAEEGVKKAFADYADSAKDSFQNAYDAMSKTLSNAEDKLVELARTGKASFKDMANSIIEDMIRIMIRQSVTKPLADAGSTAMSAAFKFMFAAKGDTFSGTGLSAYTNSVVNRPTPIMLAKGAAVIGEKPASPGEAVMPLTRDSSGDLAVSAVGLDGLRGGSSGGVYISVAYHDNRQTSENAQGGSEQERQKASKLTGMIKQVVHETIIREQRPGGLLA